MDQPSTPTPTGRSRRRRNVIRSSPNRKEYERLMKAGWSSLALERYAAFRYGEDIPSQTIRSYRKRLEAEAQHPDTWNVDADETMDVIGLRADLIRLQVHRIGIDHKHEQAMGKLFGSTAREIALLDDLLDSHKRDLQDVGILPKSPDEIVVSRRGTPAPGDAAPRSLTLAGLLGIEASEQAQAAMARTLHLAASNGESVNGAATG